MKLYALGPRVYGSHVPRRLAKRSALLIALHGGGLGSPQQHERMTGWSSIADRERAFVAIYPQGVEATWNAGHQALGYAGKTGVDDVGFLDAVIRDARARWNCDAGRVYLSGFSNGSMLAHWYATHGLAIVAAVACVAGGFSRLPGSGVFTTPPAVRMVHGTWDAHVPFMGGVGPDAYDQYNHLPIEMTAAWWRAQGADVHTIWHPGRHEWRAGETEDQWAWMRGLG